VRVPATAVLGIYSRETGQGMLFQDDEGGAPPAPPGATPTGGAGKPRLRVVK
jgi:stringent starvation protein B